MSETTITFTWHAPDGREFEVEPVYDSGRWKGRELRAVDRLSGGPWRELSRIAQHGLIYAVSIARVVPGLSIADIDELLDVDTIGAIARQVNEREAAAAAAKAAPAPAPEPTGSVVDFTGTVVVAPGVDERPEVLSPSSAGSEGSSAPA